MNTSIAAQGAPAALGPYSQAISTAGTRLIFCSGQIPIDPVTGVLVNAGIEAQARQVLANLKAVLQAAGLEPRHVVRTTIYLLDLGDFERVNAVYGEFFGATLPARSTIQVAGLPRGACIEIDAIAAA